MDGARLPRSQHAQQHCERECRETSLRNIERLMLRDLTRSASAVLEFGRVMVEQSKGVKNDKTEQHDPENPDAPAGFTVAQTPAHCKCRLFLTIPCDWFGIYHSVEKTAVPIVTNPESAKYSYRVERIPDRTLTKYLHHFLGSCRQAIGASRRLGTQNKVPLVPCRIKRCDVAAKLHQLSVQSTDAIVELKGGLVIDADVVHLGQRVPGDHAWRS
jgi:hypothetical protein